MNNIVKIWLKMLDTGVFYLSNTSKISYFHNPAKKAKWKYGNKGSVRKKKLLIFVASIRTKEKIIKNDLYRRTLRPYKFRKLQ